MVGGGIAGLTAALGLAERGVRVTVLEREERLGGRVRSWPVALPDGDGRPDEPRLPRVLPAVLQPAGVLRRTDPTWSGCARSTTTRSCGDGRARHLLGHPAHAAVEPAPRSWPRSPSFDLAGPGRRIDVAPRCACSTSTCPRRYRRLDGADAADVLDRLRFPEAARHLALEVFSRSFFADPRELSGAELATMFHMYFLGSAEGLLFDVPTEPFPQALWEPLAATGRARRAVRTAPAARSAVTRGTTARLAGARGRRPAVECDAVVLATDVRRAARPASPSSRAR